MKVSLLALIATTQAVSLREAPVGPHNWPGVILAGHDIVMPKKSSFVDKDFDPIFNRFRYAQLPQQRHETR